MPCLIPAISAHMTSHLYMDYNATAPIRPSVVQAVADAMAVVGNPSSVHTAGRSARGHVETARQNVAALAGARTRDVTFCSGGTEATNAVLRGCGAASIVIAATEHDCGLAAAALAGVPVYTVNVDTDGLLDLADYEAKLAAAEKPALVSVMLVNNETGVIQPVREIAELAKQHDARMHTDAVQAAGKIMLDFNDLGVDYLTLSAHKLGGPQGVGAIVTAPTAPLKPLVAGGGQELGRRSGTENVAGVVGFGVAALEALAEIAAYQVVAALRDTFERAITGGAARTGDILIAGEKAPRSPTTSCVVMPGVRGETQVMHFDLNGICVSSGSACSSGKVKVSHVLSAMDVPADDAACSLRVSLGLNATEADVARLVEAWKSLYDRAARKRG